MKGFAAVAALGLAVMIHRPMRAQESVAGSWITEFDIGIRNENGIEMSMGKRQARITLTLKGDSVYGTWQAVPDGGAVAGEPVHLHGSIVGAKVVLWTEPVERTVNTNGDEQQVKLVTSYQFSVRADSLTGTLQMRALDGSFDGPERPFSAARAKP